LVAVDNETAEEAKSEKPVKNSDDDKSLLSRFYKLTGYSKGDCDVVNEKARVFLTTNGGKYQLNKAATSVRILKGPQYPNYEPEG